jgi:hypothetical protein
MLLVVGLSRSVYSRYTVLKSIGKDYSIRLRENLKLLDSLN